MNIRISEALVDQLDCGFIEAGLIGRIELRFRTDFPVAGIPAKVDQDYIARLDLAMLILPGSNVGGGKRLAGFQIAISDIDDASWADHRLD